MPEATPAPVIAPSADPSGDFSDKLSPMLVKELRQGLRARTFVAVFLALQGLLGLVLLSASGAARTPQSAGHAISGVIFMFFSMAVLVIQPLRGIGALHREIEGRTIELMVLTRLSAWKIVLGKWISIVSQSALLLAAIIPYLILRYWFGDMNLFGEMILLILVFCASAAATALTVGLSAIPSVIIRGLLPLVGGAFLLIAIPSLCFGRGFDSLVEFCSMQGSDSFWSVILIVLAAAYLSWVALGLGASMIAPAAENHSTPRRLVTLGLLLALIAIGLFVDLDQDAVIWMMLIVTVPALMMSFTEPFHLLPPVCKPFLARGALGRIAGRFLYPGWPSGTFFAVLAVALSALLLFTTVSSSPSPTDLQIFISLLGTLVMPAALMGPVHQKIKSRFTVYLLLLVMIIIMTAILAIMAETMPSSRRGFLWIFAWLPSVTLIMAGNRHSYAPESVLFVSTLVTAIYSLILVITSALRFPAIREVESEAAASESS